MNEQGALHGERKFRVAIVDDDEDIRFLVQAWIRSDPRFEVCGLATDGTEAVTLAEREQPDVMVLDIMMPVMGGLEAAPLIKGCSPATRIVLFTARTTLAVQTPYVDAFVSKARTKADLLSALIPDLESATG